MTFQRLFSLHSPPSVTGSPEFMNFKPFQLSRLRLSRSIHHQATHQVRTRKTILHWLYTSYISSAPICSHHCRHRRVESASSSASAGSRDTPLFWYFEVGLELQRLHFAEGVTTLSATVFWTPFRTQTVIRLELG